mmetsp:Transcript_62774/g.76816  ORF Transcript_62774/g.76816 Transcript_62774/m.76816 type:complete len:520 (+) Transcript_62774:32-1591(+)
MSIKTKTDAEYGSLKRKQTLSSKMNKRRRTDLYDRYVDTIYGNTEANSPVYAPILLPKTLQISWNEKALKQLNGFQKPRIYNNKPNKISDAVMNRLNEISTKIEFDDEIAGLQDEILGLCYSNNIDKLNQPNSRGKKGRYHHNKNRDTKRKFYSDWYKRLPGPQPHSVSRQNLNKLKSMAYYVTEKSDGIRMMLLFSNIAANVFFVDRKFEFYKINHPFYAKYLRDHRGSSLLDGELIMVRNELTFLAFDCICIYGISKERDVTSERIKAVSQFISKSNDKRRAYLFGDDDEDDDLYARMSNYKKKKVQKTDDLTVKIKQKIHELHHLNIETVIKRISKNHEGEYIYTDERTKRISKTDGLIFTPENNTYMMEFDPSSLLKWKPLEKNTIDLKVKSPYFFRGMCHLYANGPKSMDILFAKVKCTKKWRLKFDRLYKEMQLLCDNRNKFVNEFIIEFEWDFADATWYPYQNRPDKYNANFITTCTDTVKVMMDNVTKTDLCNVCKAYKPTINNDNDNDMY